MKQVRLAWLFLLAIMFVLPYASMAADETAPAKEVGERSVLKKPAPDKPAAAEVAPSPERPAPAKPSEEPQSPERQALEPAQPETQLYTACNLWYEKPNRISSINYKRGTRLPAATPIRDAQIEVGTSGLLRGRALVRFVRIKDGMLFTLVFEPEYHPKETIEDYKRKVITTKDFEALTKGFTETELRAVRTGKLKIGMSKDAVLVAWGYPPKHRTPSRESKVWTYWLSRIPNRIKKIHFDSHGKTVRFPQENREPDDL